MKYSGEVALWFDDSSPSREALKALKQSGLSFDCYDVNKPEVSAEEQPPLLTTPEGTFSGLEAIVAYLKIPDSTRRWMRHIRKK